MTEKEYTVYLVLQHWRSIEPNQFTAQHVMKSQEKACGQQGSYISNVVLNLEGWLALLSDDERYIVRRHLVEGASWSGVQREYCKMRQQTKSLTTLRRIQARALAKIEYSAPE